MDIRLKVGQRIKELRKDLHLTQESLAFKAEVDKTYLNEVENGKRNVSVINLEKIVFALEVSVKEFFDDPVFQDKKKKK
ncbi:MAG: helix-turn-helix domain-containing protein [Flavipsychrobacter sp.]